MTVSPTLSSTQLNETADLALTVGESPTTDALNAQRGKTSGSPEIGGGSLPADKLAERLAAIDRDLQRGLGSGRIEDLVLSDIRPNPSNARKHSDRQIEMLAASIRQFGFIGVIAVDESGTIIAGHGRYEAAKRLGMESLPCVRVTHLTNEAKAALSLADNRLAELSTWDEPVLAVTLGQLSLGELDFDLEITGFDTIDLDRLLGPEPLPRKAGSADCEFSTDPDDDVLEIPILFPAISQPGDLWVLGDHRILHGDALEAASYRTLLDGERAAQIVTDPPYNVPNRGHVSSRKFREFAMAAGEMSPSEFTDFLSRALALCASVARDGAIFHVCMDWRHMPELMSAAADTRLVMKNLCVWAKPSAGQGSFYRSQHELVLVLKHGTAQHINNFGLGSRGRYRSNVWRYPAVRGLRQGPSDPDGGHPTVKPVSMIMDAIRDCSRRKDVILDPFGGSGTTLIAAERVGRQARLIEIDGHYVDLTIGRWQAITGGVARRASDDASFDLLAAARGCTQPGRERG